MTGVPTLAVYLDDGTGTYPYDITQYVRLNPGSHVDRGRADEFAESDASAVDLALRNNDGRFSLGSAQYDCQPGQGLKFVQTKGASTFTLFGFVDAWPTSWVGPLGTVSVSRISAIDVQATASRTQIESMLEAEVRIAAADGASTGEWTAQAYYPLTEKSGASAAGDKGGFGRDPLLQTGSGTDVAFGTVDGPEWFTTPEASAPTFAGDKYLATTDRLVADTGETAGVAVSAFIRTTAAQGTIAKLRVRASGTSFIFGISGTGHLEIRVNEGGAALTSPSPVNDGETHHVGFRAYAGPGGTGLRQIYVDGADVVSAVEFQGVDGVQGLEVGNDFIGMISHVVVGNKGLGAHMDEFYGAGLTGFAGETAAQRIARLGRYVGTSASSTATTIMAAQQLAGSSIWSQMQQVEDAEGGRLYVGQTGDIVLKSRAEGWAAGIGPVALTVPVTSIDHDDLVIAGDRQFLFNSVKGTRDSGAEQSYANTDSMAKYGNGEPARGVYPKDLGSLLLTTDDEVRDRCAWVANVYGEVAPRMSSVTINLLAASNAIAAAALALEIGSRIQVTDLPSQSPVDTADLIVEGWDDDVTEDSWSRTFNTTPAVLQQVWTLEDPVYGAYDSNPLAY